jgi:hypothetical protein
MPSSNLQLHIRVVAFRCFEVLSGGGKGALRVFHGTFMLRVWLA